MAKLDSKHLDEQAQGLIRSAGLIALVFALGIGGYLYFGGSEYGVLDAVYMTMITLTTVGYGEIIDLSGNPARRIFTVLLLVIGVGSFVYFFSNLTAFMVEGNLDRILWRRRMRRSINELSQHFIVCGTGRIGQHMIRELLDTERPFVVVEIDEVIARTLQDQLDAKFPVVVGDATDDEVLRQAGIERAAGLCTAVSSDKDNLVVTMTARMIRADLRIVARCTDPKIHKKLRRAGADAIVSPEVIGGLRLVSELIRPDAVTFLDTMLRDKEKRLRIEEVTLRADAKAVGRSIGALRAEGIPELLIIALRQGEAGAWTFNPGDAHTLAAGQRIVMMASPEARRLAEERWA